MNRNKLEIAGQRFGRLVVVSYVGPDRNGHSLWSCRCDCGGQVQTLVNYLRRGDTKSCGCIKPRRNKGGSRSHGHCLRGENKATPTYRSWRSMVERCTKASHKSYVRYGGAGIGVTEPWLSFENFLADMGARPEGTTLDRVDPSLGYDKANCRWATPAEQSENCRSSPAKVSAIIESLAHLDPVLADEIHERILGVRMCR